MISDKSQINLEEKLVKFALEVIGFGVVAGAFTIPVVAGLVTDCLEAVLIKLGLWGKLKHLSGVWEEFDLEETLYFKVYQPLVSVFSAGLGAALSTALVIVEWVDL